MTVQPSRRGPARPGFTLVELLVVIGIIAILLAILLPTISRAKLQANTTACAATLRSLGQAIKIYETEFRTYPFSLYMSNNVTLPNRSSIDDGSDDPNSAATHTWWSVLRKVMRGGQGNWDNSVMNIDASRSTRFMAAFNCAQGYNRDAGCDFGSNPVIMPELRYETATGPGAILINGPLAGRRLTRPATANRVYSDNIVLYDAAELAHVNPPYTRQYVCGYDLDGGSLMEPVSRPRHRFRGLLAPNHVHADGTLADPGRNVDGDGSSGTLGQIRWRHGRNDSANFLMGDGSVRTMRITVNYDTPNVRGELTRAMLRPKPPPGYPH